MSKTLRIATSADVDTLFDIRTSVHENHLSMEQLSDLGITPDLITKLIRATPCAWVAEVNDAVVGFSMVDIEEGCVFAAFVRSAFEGQGLGRALMAEAETLLFQSHPRIWLVTAGASRASGFYRNLGWVPVEGLPGGDIRFEKRRN